MQNDAGEYVDMYIPRKWFVIMFCSAGYYTALPSRHATSH